MTEKSIASLPAMSKTDRKGIVVGRSAYDRGYWARYNGEPRPARKSPRRDGWDECDAELAHERKPRKGERRP